MQSYLGIDIGSHSIKLVELGTQGNVVTLLSAGAVPTPPRGLGTTGTAETEVLISTIKKLVKDTQAKSTSVRIALPESQVFTRVIEIPQLSKQELSASIHWEAEQYIPLPLDQVTMDFTVLREAKDTPNNMMQVLLVAAPKILVDKYVNLVESSNLGITGIETEITSASRAITPMTKDIKTALLVSIGAQTTDLAILRNGIIAFTRSFSAGGEALSRALVQGLGFRQNQAEEFKRTYGLDRSQLEGKIVEAVRPIMDAILNEIKRAIAFYQEKYVNDRVELLLLSGGTARIPGMTTYMAENTGIEAQVANPWIGIQKEPRFAVLETEGPVFTVAVGLARK